MAQDLGISVPDLDNIPLDELYIFPGTPAPKDIEEQNVTTTSGVLPRNQSYSYHSSEQPAHEVAGGSVKIIDPLTFPIAENFSSAIVTVKPGGLREIHWHTASDEWTFFIRGQGRATLFSAPDVATTFDFRAGDVGYFPQYNSHYIQNTGDEDLVFVEVLLAPQFTGKNTPQRPQYAADSSRHGSWPMDFVHSQEDHLRYPESQQRDAG
jgi:oxalate decarboxylase family bicupin protein